MTTQLMTSIARPYAKAAFEYALAQHELSKWEEMLNSASSLINDPSFERLLSSPQVASADLVGLVCEILAPVMDSHKENFIRLLAENKRLTALPDIAKAFEELRSQYEETIAVQVTSAVTLDESYQQKLMTALTKRLNKKVLLECSIDPSLLGGVKVTAGDLVLDGSISGKLSRLSEFI